MKKKVIAFDCDGVTADIATSMITWHNSSYHTHHRIEELNTYFIRDLWKCSEEEEYRKLDEFYKSKYFANLHVINGSIEGIRRITDNINNVALTLTARPENIHDATRKWFRRHFPGKFNGIYFSKSHSFKGNGYKEKAELCRELCSDIIVEDSVENAIKCHEAGIRTIVFNQPWNEDCLLPKGIMRAKNWEELTEMLLK